MGFPASRPLALPLAAGGAALALAWPAAAAVPGARAKAHAATVAERRALAALPAGGPSRGACVRALGRVRASLRNLLALEGVLATAARETGPIANGDLIQLRLDDAYGGANLAATQLGQVIWLLDRSAPAGNPSLGQIRADLRRALKASRALERLLR